MADTTTRRCIGSTRYGIEAHDAPVEDFPVQPSQKDGLGRMCKVHWNAYTAGLARDAKARKAAETPAEDTSPSEAQPEPKGRSAKSEAPTEGEAQPG